MSELNKISFDGKGSGRMIAIVFVVVIILLSIALVGTIVNDSSIINEKNGIIENKDSQLDALNETIDDLTSNLQNLTDLTSGLTHQINNLSDQVSNLTNQVSNLTSLIGNITGSGFPATITSSKGSTATTFTWTVTSITGLVPILKTDVYVQVKYASNSTFAIQTVILATASGTHGFTYSPATGGSYIAVGDTFSISRTAGYSTGDTITLVKSAGATAQYCVFTL